MNRAETRRPAARRWATVTTVLTTATLALAGCTTGNASAPEGGASTDTINTTFNADPTTFSPAQGRNADDYMAGRLLFDTLVRRGTDNSIVPNLASSWEVTPTRGVFTIGENGTCSDGTRVTPTVVADSLKNFASPDTNSNFRELVFGPGRTTITADDQAGTVTIDVTEPWADMLQGLSMTATGIVCPDGLADPEGLKAGTAEGAFSGPYALAEKQSGVKYAFKLREDYASWPQYEPAIAGVPAATINASVNANSSAVANELLTGTRDIAIIRGKDMSRFDGQKGFTAEKFPIGSLFALFNEREGSPSTDADLRRSVARVVDRNAFVQAATGGQGEPYYSFAHPSVPCAVTDASAVLPQDLAAAAETLNGEKIKFLGTQVFGPNGAANTYVSEAMRQAGADVDLRNVDLATWSTDSQKPEKWDMTLMGAINAGGTMYGALSVLIGPSTESGGLNWTGNENPELEALVAEAMAEEDEATRCGIYREIQKVVVEDAHAVPLGSLVAQTTARDGFAVSVFNGQRDESTMRITK